MVAARSPTVLVIDDHSDTRSLIQAMLASQGITNYSAPTREDALQTLQAVRVDLILLDYFMGGMSAFQFVARVRKLGFAGRIVLISQPQMLAVNVEIAGVDECVGKPITEDKLMQMLTVKEQS